MKRSVVFGLILLTLAATGAGCAEKFNRANYETIYVGQPASEVRRTLGEPYAEFSDSWTYLHKEPFYKAVIAFQNGRVSDKAFYYEENMDRHPDSK